MRAIACGHPAEVTSKTEDWGLINECKNIIDNNYVLWFADPNIDSDYWGYAKDERRIPMTFWIDPNNVTSPLYHTVGYENQSINAFIRLFRDKLLEYAKSKPTVTTTTISGTGTTVSGVTTTTVACAFMKCPTVTTTTIPITATTTTIKPGTVTSTTQSGSTTTTKPTNTTTTTVCSFMFCPATTTSIPVATTTIATATTTTTTKPKPTTPTTVPPDGKYKVSGMMLTDEDDIPLCAMVLANGDFMFTCKEKEVGKFDLKVPLDAEGKITLFGFCDGLSPFRVTLTPDESVDYDIFMLPPSDDSREMNVIVEGFSPINAKKARLYGKVMVDDTPLCAMALANGEKMFTCDPIGEFDLEVPLDANGELTFFVFCDGMLPYKKEHMKP